MKHTFIISVALLCAIPTASRADVRDVVPHPVFSANPELVDLYYKTWEYAEDHIAQTPGMASARYMDEGCRDGNGPETIWIWDTEFMALFCKYAPDYFPGIESLRNFYVPLLDGGPSPMRIHHPDNPPFFAWIEYEHFKFTADRPHLDSLIRINRYPQRYFDYFNTLDNSRPLDFGHQKVMLKNYGIGFDWGPNQSGMDNTARDREGKIFWVDAISQQALSALYTARLARIVGDRKTAKRFSKEYETLKRTINKYYWDSAAGCYFDIFQKDSTTTGILTPASFWPVLAEIPDAQQVSRMIEFALDSTRLGGERPWKSLDPHNKRYVADGGKYWRGAIWLPTAYMGIKSLEKYGHQSLADDTAERLLKQMLRTYQDFEPHTVWECYDPSADRPALNKKDKLVRQDFCGWSALGPISLFIENVIGISEVDATRRIVRWNIHHDFEHGLNNLRFGDVVADLLYLPGGEIKVHSNASFTLFAGGKKFKVKPGDNRFSI